jgi:pantoate--beta-alanine ligase
MRKEMEIIRVPRVMQDIAFSHRLRGKTVGFVPTMGALHEGHLNLVRMCREENDIAVVSVYVNPTQFGPAEDLSKYPRDFDGDRDKLALQDVDILFLPDDSVIYPAGFSTFVEVKNLSEKLCGAFRPGHFKGVATVVAKLFGIVNPSRAYFGMKDFQQTVIIRRMVRDLNSTVEVVVCPTMREPDGLAMSSRNAYLTPEERKAATVIYRALMKGSEGVKSGIIEGNKLRNSMLAILRTEPLVSEIQYCSAYDPEALDELEQIGHETLLAIALKIGATRLIDNMLVTRASEPEHTARCGGT